MRVDGRAKGLLLDRLGVTGEERLRLANVLDRASQSQTRSLPAATDFLTPRQQAVATDLLSLAGIPETRYLFTGGYEGAERRLILFLPDWMERERTEDPVRALRASFRKEDAPTHRDFLGSLMGMGIVREKLGDILVTETSADLMVSESIAGFLAQSWESAGRARVRVREIDPAHIHVPQARCQEVRDTVSSLRLDAVIASGFRMSRTKAAELIAAGRVQINWRLCAKADKILSQGDTISARGFGKITLAEAGGLTRKGRVSVVIRRFL